MNARCPKGFLCPEPLWQKAWIHLETEQGPLGREGFPAKLGGSPTGGWEVAVRICLKSRLELEAICGQLCRDEAGKWWVRFEDKL